MQAGLIRRWTTDVMGTVKRGIMKGKEESKTEVQKGEGGGILALTLVHMQGPFFLYTAGMIVSLIVFLSENVSIICIKNRFILVGKQIPFVCV